MLRLLISLHLYLLRLSRHFHVNTQLWLLPHLVFSYIQLPLRNILVIYNWTSSSALNTLLLPFCLHLPHVKIAVHPLLLPTRFAKVHIGSLCYLFLFLHRFNKSKNKTWLFFRRLSLCLCLVVHWTNSMFPLRVCHSTRPILHFRLKHPFWCKIMSILLFLLTPLKPLIKKLSKFIRLKGDIFFMSRLFTINSFRTITFKISTIHPTIIPNFLCRKRYLKTIPTHIILYPQSYRSRTIALCSLCFP